MKGNRFQLLSGFLQVSTGKKIHKLKWELSETVHSCTFKQLAPWITKLLKSDSEFSSLIITKMDKRRCLSLWSRHGRIQAFFVFDLVADGEFETAVRQLFESKGIRPEKEFVSQTRNVLFPLKRADLESPHFARQLLTASCGLLDDQSFEVDYHSK